MRRGRLLFGVTSVCLLAMTTACSGSDGASGTTNSTGGSSATASGGTSAPGATNADGSPAPGPTTAGGAPAPTVAGGAPAPTVAGGAPAPTPTVAGGAPDAASTLTIQNSTFSAASGFAGSAFSIINKDGIAHTVTDSAGAFNLDIPAFCPDVPVDVLKPRTTWADGAAYDAQAARLARMFVENFKAFAQGVTVDVLAAGPNA